MWDDYGDEPDEDWEPLRTRHRGPMQVVALLIVAAMLVALVVPVVLRLLREDPAEPSTQDGVKAAVTQIEANRL